jgi:serine/threonine protein kinase
MIATEHEPPGESLRDRLEACRRAGLPGIPADELFRYVREVAAALDELHGRNVLHGDVKPDTVLLRDGRAVLSDAGASKAPPAATTVAGTPAYMAPELWRGRAEPRSDQYGLAVSYAELRVGHRPFAGADVPTAMREHLEQPPNLDSLPPAEQQVLRRALAKEPGQRYPNCTAFCRQLGQALGHAGPG